VVIQRLALVGASGMLAGMVQRLAPKNYDIAPLDLPDFDLADRVGVLSAMEKIRPDVIVNCAAYTNVDGCESNEEVALLVNGAGPGYLAEAAIELGATLVHVSTDYVFDGTKKSPYTEDDTVNPKSAYGRTKLQGERAILDSGLAKFFIVRTSWLYGPGGKNFVETILRLAQEREELRVVADQFGTPTYTEDLAAAIFRLLPTKNFGIYHVSGQGECSWYEFACEIVAQYVRRGGQVMVKKIVPITTVEYPLPAIRPAYSVFSKGKYEATVGVSLPSWRVSLARYFDSRPT
jgi:dTDP-4-dehydrorhamnose reductase